MWQERQKNNKVGESGFVHFYGVVEDRNDPKRLGRLRVRVFGDHTEKLAELPTEELPWAQVIMPMTGMVNTTPNAWDGQLVFGFYADSHDKQVPIILGQVAGDGMSMQDEEGAKSSGFMDQRETKEVKLPNGKSAAQGVNTGHGNPDKYKESAQYTVRNDTKHSNGNYSEPADETGSQYPYNTSVETESGHLIEYDDSPGNERINIFHRTGSRVELLKDGSVIFKSVNNRHDIANGNSFDSTGGNHSRVVGGSVNDTVGGAYTLKVNGGDLSISVSGNANINVSGSCSTKVGGAYNIEAGTFTVKAGTINLN